LGCRSGHQGQLWPSCSPSIVPTPWASGLGQIFPVPMMQGHPDLQARHVYAVWRHVAVLIASSNRGGSPDRIANPCQYCTLTKPILVWGAPLSDVSQDQVVLESGLDFCSVFTSQPRLDTQPRFFEQVSVFSCGSTEKGQTMWEEARTQRNLGRIKFKILITHTCLEGGLEP
jgi:hypothetical protein